MDDDQARGQAGLVPVVVTRTRRTTGWEWFTRNGWFLWAPLLVMGLLWVMGGTFTSTFFWVMIAVAISGGTAGGSPNRRRLTESRTLLVDPQRAADVQRALEAVMGTERADQVWRALDSATDGFGAITDQAFYSWVDAEIATLPAITGSQPTSPQPPQDSHDSTQQQPTWVQPPH